MSRPPLGTQNRRAVSIEATGTVPYLLALLAILSTFASVVSASESFTVGTASDVEIARASTIHDVSFDVDLADGETTHVEIDTSNLPAGASLTAIQGVTTNNTEVNASAVGVTGAVANVSVSDTTTNLLINPGPAKITVTLELDTSGANVESTGVPYDVDEVGIGANPDGSVSFDLVDTIAPTYDAAVTGDLPTGDSTANDTVTLNVTDDGTGVNESTVTTGDFTVDGSAPADASVTTIGGQEVIQLTLGTPLSTDATPTVELTGSFEDDAGNVLSGPVSKTAGDGLAPVISSAVYNDTDGDGQVDRLTVTYSEAVSGSYVDGDWSIPTAGTVSLSKDGMGTFSSPAVELDVTGGANATGGSTAPEVRYSGSTVTDTSGNANAAQSETVGADDVARPVKRSVEARDADADGRIDRIDVAYSEDVSASNPETGDYTLGGSDSTNVSVTGANVAGAVVRLAVDAPEGSTGLDLTVEYDAAAGSVDSVTDGTTPATSFTGASVADSAPPTITNVTVLDRDSDGSVDAADVTFSEPIDDSSVTPSDYAIGENATDALDTLGTSDDETVQLRIATDADEVGGTDAKELTYSPGATTDLAGNALAAVGTGDIFETDGATPIVSNFTLSVDSGEELVVTFDATESLANATVDVTGPETGSITSFATTGTTHEGRLSVERTGEYTATLTTAVDTAGNAATTLQSETATVESDDDTDESTDADSAAGGSSDTSVLTDVSTSERLASSTGLLEVGVRFDGPRASTIDVRSIDANGGPPGVYVAGVHITVAEELGETPSTVKFAVSRERIDALDVDATWLAVYKYRNGEWIPLETRVDSRPELVVVVAETPGFSRFAVVAIDPVTGELTTVLTDGDASNDHPSGGTSNEGSSEGTPVSTSDGEVLTEPERTSGVDVDTATNAFPDFVAALSILLVLVAALAAIHSRS